MLAQGAIEGVRLPRERGGCAASLGASIGYRDPRGLPVWEGARVGSVPAIELAGERATVTLTVVTRFADRGQVSVEDDLVYLERGEGGWLVRQPSLTFYRAIGAEPPPEALVAP